MKITCLNLSILALLNDIVSTAEVISCRIYGEKLFLIYLMASLQLHNLFSVEYYYDLCLMN